jgi:hypothetical protein
MSLPDEYQKLISLGIDKTANLPDLNDLTDRGKPGKPPLKPWTAAKTIGTIKLIRDFNIKDEETLFKLFQVNSKIKIEDLVEQVYEYQKSFFGFYKHEKEMIFKYAYCCIIINSLTGFTTEDNFDSWAKSKNATIKNSPVLLDEKFHTDRLELNSKGEILSFISIKPGSFAINCIKYTDVFAGLQLLSNLTAIPWKIFYTDGEEFAKITIESFTEQEQNYIEKLSNNYSKDEVEQIKYFLINDLGLQLQ